MSFPYPAPVLAVLAAALGALACGPTERPGTPPKHLVLVTVDTLRADHLSSWLYPRDTSNIEVTPEQREAGEALSIDDLAREGVQFAHAFAPRGMTFPSMATLFTGKSPMEHGALSNGDPLPLDEITLAELLKGEGFRTVAFTTNQLLVEVSGIAQGFDHFDSRAAFAEDQDLAMIQSAMQWLAAEEPGDGPPLFLWLHFMGPHLPYAPPAPPPGAGMVDYAQMFVDPDYAGEADGSREFLDAAYREGRPLDGLDVHRVVALYDGEIARVNFLLRYFLQAWAGLFDDESPNLLDETLLVFASDHGEELYQRHGYWAHSKSVYDSVLHVPLFFRHPASLTGERVFDEIVELQDVLPTVLDWFEVEPPDGVRGRSLLDLVDAPDRSTWEPRPAFGMWQDRVFTARTRDWRFISNPGEIEPDDPPAGAYPIPKEALYDEHRDPLELRNVKDEEPEALDAMRRELGAWLASLRVRTPSGESISEAYEEALRFLGYAGKDR